MKKYDTPPPQYFSDYFGIEREKLDELGVFDPILNYDTKAFVNPLLLEQSHCPIMRNSYHIFESFFVDIISLLKASKQENDKAWRTAKSKLKFPEYQETCLGYGKTTKGSGSRTKLNTGILRSAQEIIKLSVENPRMFLLLPLLESDMGSDRISDMTQTIIDKSIVDYTVNIMQKLGLEGTKQISKIDFDKSYSHSLLENPFSSKVVKFIPKDIICFGVIQNDFGKIVDQSFELNTAIRETVDNKLGQAFFTKNKAERKEEIFSLLRQDPHFFIEIMQFWQDQNSETVYDIDKDPKGLHRWLSDARRLPIIHCEQEIDNFQSLYDNVLFFIDTIKNLIKEYGSGFFWSKEEEHFVKVEISYPRMIVLVLLFVFFSREKNNIQIKHLEKKNSKIEISIDGHKKVILDIYSDSSQNLEKNYKNILINCTNNRPQNIFLIFRFKPTVSNILQDVQLIQKKEICPVICIDVSNDQIYEDSQIIEIEPLERVKTAAYKRHKKGSNFAHQKTNDIKVNVIKPIYVQIKKNSRIKTVRNINEKILELFNETECTKEGAQKIASQYNLKVHSALSALEYYKNHPSGGQIPTWCYHINQGKL